MGGEGGPGVYQGETSSSDGRVVDCFSFSDRQRMRFQPECSSGSSRIDTDLLPPCWLIAIAMQLAMMATAERHCEFVAHLSAKRAVLRKAQMMGVGGHATANQTWLFGNELDMLAIANSTRFGMTKFAFVDARGVGPSSRFARSGFRALADDASIFELCEFPLECLFDPLGISCNQGVLVSEHAMRPSRGLLGRANVLEFGRKAIVETA